MRRSCITDLWLLIVILLMALLLGTREARPQPTFVREIGRDDEISIYAAPPDATVEVLAGQVRGPLCAPELCIVVLRRPCSAARISGVLAGHLCFVYVPVVEK